MAKAMSRWQALTIPLILAGYCVFATARASLGVVFPEMKVELGLTEVGLGAIASSVAGASIVTMVAAGYLTDRFRRFSYLAGMIVMSLGLIMTLVARTYMVVLLCFLTFGLGVGILVPAVYGTIGREKSSSRGYWLGIAMAVYSLGGIIGPSLTGLLILAFDWRGPFVIFGFLSVVIMIAYHFSYRSKRPLEQSLDAKEKRKGQGLREVIKSRNIGLVCVTMISSNFAWSVLLSWEPTFLREVQNFDPTSAGTIFGGLFAGSMVGAVVLGRLSDRYGRPFTISLSGLASALISYLSYSFAAPTFAPVLLASLGFMTGPYWNIQTALAQDSVKQSAVGTATGLTQGVGLSSATIAPIIAGAITPWLGWGNTLILTVSLPLFIYGITGLTLRQE